MPRFGRVACVRAPELTLDAAVRGRASRIELAELRRSTLGVRIALDAHGRRRACVAAKEGSEAAVGVTLTRRRETDPGAAVADRAGLTRKTRVRAARHGAPLVVCACCARGGCDGERDHGHGEGARVSAARSRARLPAAHRHALQLVLFGPSHLNAPAPHMSWHAAPGGLRSTLQPPQPLTGMPSHIAFGPSTRMI